MFNDKEKRKFYAELLRNLGTAVLAGAYISLSVCTWIDTTIHCLSGLALIGASALIMEE